METIDKAGSRTSGRCSWAWLGQAPCDAKRSTDGGEVRMGI